MSKTKKPTKIDIFASEKNKKSYRPKPLTTLQFIAVAVVALVIEGLTIYVSSKTASNFSASHLNDGCNNAKPNASGFAILAFIGLAVVLFGLIKAFQQKNYLIRCLMIVLLVVCLILSFYAWAVIALAGSCFF